MVLVDSNVLLDVFTGDEVWLPWSARVLSKTADRARLVVNPIIFSEVSVGFERIEELDAALPRDIFHREDLPYEAAFLAGKRFKAYRERGGTKRSPLPDFFIGAHAAVVGYAVLTRDVSRYRTYFPSVVLISPDEWC